MNTIEKYINIDLDSEGFDYAGTFQMKSIVDWNKLEYNTTYKSPEFFRNKFPIGFEYLTGFETLFEKMAEKAKSPYEEMMEIISRGDANCENKLLSNSNNDEQS